MRSEDRAENEGTSPLRAHETTERPPEERRHIPSHGGRKRRRATDGLIGMSAAAIISIYAAGYLHTRSANGEVAGPPRIELILAATTTPTSQMLAPSQTTPVPANPTTGPQSAAVIPSTTPQGQAPRPQPTAIVPATPTRSPLSQGAYRDGSYVGQGTSRHGDIEATVVINDGKIASARISRCMTRYPCSDVNPLVSEVVAHQAVPVDHVSGATDSSTAFKQAVKAALAKAA